MATFRTYAEALRPDHPLVKILGIAELAEVPVSLEHLRHADPRTRVLIGYRPGLNASGRSAPSAQ